MAKLYRQIPCKDPNEAQLDGEKKTALLTGLAVNKAESNCRLLTECAPDAPFRERASDLMARKGMNPQQLGRASSLVVRNKRQASLPGGRQRRLVGNRQGRNRAGRQEITAGKCRITQTTIWQRAGLSYMLAGRTGMNCRCDWLNGRGKGGEPREWKDPGSANAIDDGSCDSLHMAIMRCHFGQSQTKDNHHWRMVENLVVAQKCATTSKTAIVTGLATKG